MAKRRSRKVWSTTKKTAKAAYKGTRKFMQKHQVVSRGKSFLAQSYSIPMWAILVVGGFTAYQVWQRYRAFNSEVKGLLV